MMICPPNNPEFDNNMGQMYFRSKTRQRETLQYLTWIYSCRGTVNFTLPFMKKVTISISILKTFHSWVALFHLRQRMVFLFHILYDMPGLAPQINVLFWGQRDFPISFSNRDHWSTVFVVAYGCCNNMPFSVFVLLIYQCKWHLWCGLRGIPVSTIEKRVYSNWANGPEQDAWATLHWVSMQLYA